MHTHIRCVFSVMSFFSFFSLSLSLFFSSYFIAVLFLVFCRCTVVAVSSSVLSLSVLFCAAIISNFYRSFSPHLIATYLVYTLITCVYTHMEITIRIKLKRMIVLWNAFAHDSNFCVFGIAIALHGTLQKKTRHCENVMCYAFDVLNVWSTEMEILHRILFDA